MKHALQVISISHQTATLEQRQALQLSREEAAAFMQELKAAGQVEGVLVLTTCNRTEVYYETTAAEPTTIQQALLRFKNLEAAAFSSLFTHHSYSESTLLYLLEVGLGLRSRVLGDRQIIGQLKDSYRLTNEQKLGSPLLHQALQTLFRAHKRVHNETDFRVGAASVGYAALERLTDFFPRKEFVIKRMLIIGTGQMGTDIARYASSFGFRDIVLTNRTDARAEALAQELGLKYLPFSDYKQALSSFDVVVSCVGSGAQLQAAAFGEAKSKRVLLDLSVPQGIAPGSGQLANTTLVNIDQISSRTQAVLATRQAAITTVEQIVAEETESFAVWLQDQPVAHAIGELKSFFAEVLGSELQRHIGPANKGAAQAIAKATLDRLIRRPAGALRTTEGIAREQLLQAMQQLFRTTPSEEKISL
ncbi:glutamyl-tRNA reductase [uncultured Pontibacter sp.]|uniref:glutamyl-tRNA reductase n=1 Tax=uncultured Pontibacter sp. TaxID=453356 RepID=UPI0026087F60|nr:glutamyl-tRNA reductase [uncultured Pontibacter sp.]